MKHTCALVVLFFLLMSTSTAFALNPSRTYKQRPDKYNMEYTEHTVTTRDGAKLKAWHIPAKTKSTKLILISHNGEGNMGDYLRRVDQFTSAGYNVVTYDYRGFGESSSFKIDNKMYIYPHLQDDMKAMIDFCRKKYAPTFDVYGWGVGGGLSLGVGWSSTSIRAIIADTPFLSMEDLEERFSSWDEPKKTPGTSYRTEYQPLLALKSAPATPKGQTKKVKLIVGGSDKLFKAADMKTLAAKQSKVIDQNIYVVARSDGKDNYRVSSAAYFKVVKTFLGAK
jgi:pimeloyl-ACP methyl ester carboxylesterase